MLKRQLMSPIKIQSLKKEKPKKEYVPKKAEEPKKTEDKVVFDAALFLQEDA